MICNLCGCEEFLDMGKRRNVRCARCNSLERTRLLWLYIQREGVVESSRILHIAPEKGIYNALSATAAAANYVTADLEPARYPFAKNCRRIDLCDLDAEPGAEYDLILHSHVLEHVPCNIAYTLFHLHRMLKPDGLHLFIAPFMHGKYEESFADLQEAERTRRFGQRDHVRRFGADDIASHLGKILVLPERFDATQDFDVEQLRKFNVPESHWTGFHGGTVLALRRNDMRFAAGF